MKPCPTASLLRLLVLRVACGGLLLPTLSFAQLVWDNGGLNNRWGTATNWSTNVAPTSTDNVQFNATDDDATVSNVELRAARVANSLTFNNVDDTFNIINGTGTQTLTLTSGDITRTAGSTGAQGLTFTTLALGGDAAMDIAGSGTFTISSAITGAGFALAKSGAGELILSGANTYSNSTTVSAGTLTLASSSALGTGSTLTLAGGTLKLSTATTTVTNLTVTATSTIDFGGANATLNITNFTISAGVTLNIINWVNASDFFYTTNWQNGGAGVGVHDTTGATPMNQVVFASFTGADTKWQGYDNQITPVPEPSTYGVLLLATSIALVLWRRRRRQAPARLVSTPAARNSPDNLRANSTACGPSPCRQTVSALTLTSLPSVAVTTPSLTRRSTWATAAFASVMRASGLSRGVSEPSA